MKSRCVIHKYTIDWNSVDDNGEIRISMPAFARVLCVKNQRENLCIWALVRTDIETLDKTFRLVMTGAETERGDEEKWTYIDTVLMSEGAFVIHVFELNQRYGHS